MEAAKTLLELGAKPNLQKPTSINATTENASCLLLATKNGHIGVVELLIRWSCGLNHTTLDGKTALYIAAQYGDFDMVQMLLYNGADPNVEDHFGFIALHPVGWLAGWEGVDLRMKSVFCFFVLFNGSFLDSINANHQNHPTPKTNHHKKPTTPTTPGVFQGPQKSGRIVGEGG